MRLLQVKLFLLRYVSWVDLLPSNQRPSRHKSIRKVAARTLRRASRCRECETPESECIFSVRRHGAFIFYRFMTIEMEVWP